MSKKKMSQVVLSYIVSVVGKPSADQISPNLTSKLNVVLDFDRISNGVPIIVPFEWPHIQVVLYFGKTLYITLHNDSAYCTTFDFLDTSLFSPKMITPMM